MDEEKRNHGVDTPPLERIRSRRHFRLCRGANWPSYPTPEIFVHFHEFGRAVDPLRGYPRPTSGFGPSTSMWGVASRWYETLTEFLPQPPANESAACEHHWVLNYGGRPGIRGGERGAYAGGFSANYSVKIPGHQHHEYYRDGRHPCHWIVFRAFDPAALCAKLVSFYTNEDYRPLVGRIEAALAVRLLQIGPV